MSEDGPRGEALRPVRIGVIGTGFGRHHLEGFEPLPGVEVVALCNRTGRALEDLAARFGIARTTTDYHDVLGMDDVDAVTIATPVHLHKQMVLEALEAGKHVLSEKPLALSAADAFEMLEAARASGLRHMTNFGFRFVPASFQVQALVREGWIGKPYHVNIRHMIPSQLDPDKPMGWRHVRALAGMGAMGDLGVHCLDLVRWWLGDFARVAALQRPLVPRRRSPLSGAIQEVEVDDATMIVGEMRCGALVSVHVSRCAAGTVSMEAEVCGSEGSLRFDRRVVLGAKAKDARFSELPVDPRFTNVPSSYGEFVASVRSGRDATPSFFDGWRVQQVADAVVRSGDAQGAWQEVPDAVGIKEP